LPRRVRTLSAGIPSKIEGGDAVRDDPGYFRFRIGPGFFAHLFKAVFQQHHRELIAALRPLIPEDAIVFDVGAHAGQFAKLFAALAPRGMVFAFEPGSYARFILRAAIRLNRTRNVRIMPFALGDRGGIATLTVPVKRSGSYGFGLSHLGRSDGRPAEFELVPVARLDEVADGLRLARLDFIKADIEGFEHRLIEGARASLARFRPALMLEMDDARLSRAGDRLDTLWQALLDLGYRPHRLAPGHPPCAAPEPGDILWLAEAAASDAGRERAKADN
jgi:FkbM family methyltransferase